MAQAPEKTTVVNRHFASYDIYIGRGTLWGNPFIRGVHGNLPEILERYEEWIRNEVAEGRVDLEPLRGQVLGCSCKPKPCHGDILVKLIDEGL